MRARIVAALLVLLLPLPATAQIRTQGERLATAYAHADALSVTNGHADELDNAVTDVRWLRFAEGIFAAAEIADAASTYLMLGKTDAQGQPIYSEANPILPQSRVAIMSIKVAAAAGGIALAEKLWSGGHRWQALAVLGGAAVATMAAVGNNVYLATRGQR